MNARPARRSPGRPSDPLRRLARAAAEQMTSLVRRAARLCRRLRRDRRLQVGFGHVVAATETLTFLPVALLLVLLLHERYGPAPTLAAIVISRLLARRPSVRALSWMSGGLYLAVLLVDAGNNLARQPVDPVAGPTHDLLALACTAGGIASFVLTFALPAGRTAAGHFPHLSRALVIWAAELTKGALAGATIGAGLTGILPVAGPLSSGAESGRALTIALASTIGLVIGGLRADARGRLSQKSAAEDRSTAGLRS